MCSQVSLDDVLTIVAIEQEVERMKQISDENRLDEAAARAVRAQELLDNELLTEAFRGLEESYTSAWRASKVDDAAAREKLFLAINVVGKVRDHLAAIVANGKLAQAELKELAQVAERRRRFGIATTSQLT
jgi:hypothetical protein